MSWLDRILATPLVGIGSQAWIGFPHGIWSVLEKGIAGPWGANAGISFPNAQNQTVLRINRNNGIIFDLDMNNVAASYSYRVNFKEVAGKFPDLQRPEHFDRYTELLKLVVDELGGFLKLPGHPADRHLLRIGVVADCEMAISEIPPGVERLMDDLRGSYGPGLESAALQLIVRLATDERHVDRCIYHLAASPAAPETTVRLRMDWQRAWQPDLRVTSSSIMEQVKLCAGLAETHFEAFGSGEEDADESDA